MKLINLNHLGLLRINGEGAKKFLQGQLTCDLEEITPSQSRLGAHCNPQGRVISLFHLFLYNQEYYLQMPRELVPIALKTLQKYAVFFKVTLTDASETLQQLGYIGETLPALPHTTYEQTSLADAVIICLPDHQEARYQMIAPAPSFSAFVTPDQEVHSGDDNAWREKDILAGIAAIYPETSGKFLPHELNLPEIGAISFTKGCYTGQEIIARMQYRGKLKKHLYRAKTHTSLPITRDQDIYHQGKSKGSIVDYCQIAYNEYVLLVIADENDVQAHQLTIDAEEHYPLVFL